MEVRDKSTRKKLREVKENTIPEARDILARAKAASGELASLSREDLAKGLFAISEGLENNAGSLSRSISIETGKALKSSREDVNWASAEFRNAAHHLYSSMAERETVPVDSFDNSFMTINTKSPLGVILVLGSSPENFAHYARIIANAVSMGNAVVCIPPSLSPGPFEELKIIAETGNLPGDVFQLIILKDWTGDSANLLMEDAVSEIAFAGDVEDLGPLLNEPSGKKVIMSGKTASPVILWDDADLDSAAEYVAASAFSGYNGEYSAARKVILREDSYEYFRNRLVELASRIKVGKADEEDTDMGPLPSDKYAKEAAKQLDEAVNSGATVSPAGKISGGFFPPGVAEYLPPDSPLLMGNAHIPLVCLEKVGSMESAIEAANRFGSHVQASIFTADLELATAAAERLDFSHVLINEAPGTYSGFWHRPCGKIGGRPEKIVNLREEFSYTRIIKLKK